MMDKILAKLTDEELAYLRVESETGEYFTEILSEVTVAELNRREAPFAGELDEALTEMFTDGGDPDTVDHEPLETFGETWFPESDWWKHLV